MTLPAWRPLPLAPLVVLPTDGLCPPPLAVDPATALWAGATAPDVPPGPAERATSLRSLVPTGAIVVLGAAAWVHTGRVRPDALDVAYRTPRSTRTYRVRPRTLVLPPDEILLLGGVTVTTPTQTAGDLLRFGALPGATPGQGELDAREVVAAVRALLDAGTRVAQVQRLLTSQPERAHARRAKALLAVVLADE
ncbi:hypothetical protein [Miniimonas sp. S16]|uniref:hypothetical protein n=1 Tax=Miniimonas sp. S16 TaxID=2171623 RepID=UPI000D5271D9|nr:hypothetical protein [Miniimonas sp. S16]